MFDDIEAYLTTHVTQEIVDYEYAIFEEEFGSRSYILQLREKLYQSKYWQYSSKPVKYSLEEIKNYMHQHITDGQKVYFDRNKDTLISTNIPYTTVKFEKNIDFEYQMMLLQWSKNHIFSHRVYSIFDLVTLEFIADIFDKYDLYQKRYIMWSYYHHNCSVMNTSQHLIRRMSPDQIAHVTSEFFESYKTYFVKLIDNDQYERTNIMGILYLWQYATKDEMISCIQDISYSDITKLVSLIEK